MNDALISKSLSLLKLLVNSSYVAVARTLIPSSKSDFKISEDLLSINDISDMNMQSNFDFINSLICFKSIPSLAAKFKKLSNQLMNILQWYPKAD
jgi:hypothetical protein